MTSKKSKRLDAQGLIDLSEIIDENATAIGRLPDEVVLSEEDVDSLEVIVDSCRSLIHNAETLLEEYESRKRGAT